ncbi:asparagine synthase-related protein [Streptomyces sp. NPDC047197]|uniref:asparagine synthase-related protein n=1 Tax=Streptomyces sp. NPDC047197 TaxID=3155477 RepID=UPI0033C0281D
MRSECLRLDRVTMAHSIEARVPFLAPMVVEHAIDLPAASSAGLSNTACPRRSPGASGRLLDDASGILNVLDRINREVTDGQLREAR